MLQGRLRLLPAVVAAALTLAACGEESRPIERLERTGVTAINESEALACGADASTLRTALEVYEIREGEPAPDEAALVAEQYIRAESELWDVRDGVLVPQDPGCGDVPAAVPDENVSEIVTEEADPTSDELDDFAARVATMTPDDILADASPEEIDEVGGPICAYEVAEVGLAVARWTLDNGAEPTSLTQIVDDGYLDSLELWELSETDLLANDDSGCVGTVQMLTSPIAACRVEARTLDTAREAYLARNPDAAEPTQRDLVDDGLLRDISDRVDLVDGAVVAIAGEECEGIDLSTQPSEASADRCATDHRTLEVAIEAYATSTGRLPDNEQQLVDADILRSSFESYDVVYGEIVPGDGSPCSVPPE